MCRRRQPTAPAAWPKAVKKPADNLHPFGYGREQYFCAFMVPAALFLLGGCFAVTEAAEKMSSPPLLPALCGRLCPCSPFPSYWNVAPFSQPYKETAKAKAAAACCPP
ncbi:MAG: cation transporter [Acidaminococcales bacterium]|nr:cation transporter [Acidaminococcales bacterium]